MPLLIMLSGITFRTAYVSFNGDEVVYQKKRIIRQIKNMLWLYTLWSIVLWVFKMVFSSSVNNATSLKSLLQISIVAMPTFWFLYVLIIFYWFFIIVVHQKKQIIFCLIFGVLTCILQRDIISFLPGITATKFFQYLLFFIVGFLWRDIDIVKFKKFRIYVWGAGIVLFSIYMYSYRESLSGWTYVPFWGCGLALCLCIIMIDAGMLIERKCDGTLFCFLGKHSLQIYVMHIIVTAGVRAIAPKIGISFVLIQMLLSLILGIVVPLCVEWVMNKLGIGKLFFKPF